MCLSQTELEKPIKVARGERMNASKDSQYDL